MTAETPYSRDQPSDHTENPLQKALNHRSTFTSSQHNLQKQSLSQRAGPWFLHGQHKHRLRPQAVSPTPQPLAPITSFRVAVALAELKNASSWKLTQQNLFFTIITPCSLMTSLLQLIILFKTIRPTPTQSYFSPHPATHSCAFLAPVLTQPHTEQTLGIQTRKILLLFFWQIRFATAQLAEMSVSTGNQSWWEEGGGMPTGPAPGATSPQR